MLRCEAPAVGGPWEEFTVTLSHMQQVCCRESESFPRTGSLEQLGSQTLVIISRHDVIALSRATHIAVYYVFRQS